MHAHRPIVIAGNREEFEDWCRTHRTNPLAAVFVDSREALIELLETNTDVRLWGDHARNPAFRALQEWQQQQVA